MSEAQVHATDVLDSRVRRAIVDELATLPVLASADRPNRTRGLTAAELAERTSLHVTTVRFHLDRLARAGLVDSHEERGVVGRPRRRWTAHRARWSEMTVVDAYRLLAEVLADAVGSRDAPSAEEAGRRWAVRHADDLLGPRDTGTPAASPGSFARAVGAVTELLDRWGYEPTVNTSPSGPTATLNLHRCPLGQLAQTNPAVACGVHSGIIAGALEALGEGDLAVALTPCVQPDLCLVRLTARARPEPESASGKALT
ncbi:MAG: helix-turn-helix transcriptional regulator [Actinomycetes bacterium]